MPTEQRIAESEWTPDWLIKRLPGQFTENVLALLCDLHNSSLRALEADKKRLDWLTTKKSVIAGFDKDFSTNIADFGWVKVSPESMSLREAIDAAMGVETPTPREQTSQEAGELWKHKIVDFVVAILHGDEVHKAWLREAGEAFITGNPLPPARQKETCCAVCKGGANETGQLWRVSRKGETRPVIWICPAHFNYEDWKFVEDNEERLARRAIQSPDASNSLGVGEEKG